MIKQEFSVAGYWDIIVCYDVYLGQLDGGFTHTNYKKKRSIVGIGKSSSPQQFMNTLVHEAKHVQSHICKYYNVEEDTEDAAYLMGYIIQQMYSYFRKFI